MLEREHPEVEVVLDRAITLVSLGLARGLGLLLVAPFLLGGAFLSGGLTLGAPLRLRLGLVRVLVLAFATQAGSLLL